jgi:hypothetical protein
MSTPFKELAGSPAERFSLDAITAQRRLVVAWEDRYAMAAELLGGSYEFGGWRPAGYPGRPFVLAARIRVEPWPPSPETQEPLTDISTQLNSYSGKFALLVVDYELLDETTSRDNLPDAEERTFLSYRMDFGAEYEDLGGQVLRWASDPSLPVPPDAAPALRVPITEHHVTWHRVINPPWAAIRAAVGTVNAAAFLGAPAETVLFDGATADRQLIGVDDLQQPRFGWKMGYVFREKAVGIGTGVVGWNHQFRSVPYGSPGWDRLVDAAGNPLYRASDFTALFRFAAQA